MITIKNNRLEIEISEVGAEMQSIKLDGKDYLWNGDAAFWAGRAPIMFPICGGLKEDKYIYEGEEYTLKKHGFLKFSTFEVEENKGDSAVLLLKSDEESKKAYPFEYEVRVKFELCENSVDITYEIRNLTNGKMYFSVGAHEAYACPEGVEQYTVYFDEPENLDTTCLNGSLLTDKKMSVGENTDKLALNDSLFANDALVFTELKSRGVTLKENNGSRSVRVEFPGFDNLLLWKVIGAKYICIEPWTGIPDYEGSSYDISEKIRITELDKGGAHSVTHKITLS